MSIKLSRLAEFANANPDKRPNIVLKIDGISTCYGAVIIKKKLQYGDPVVYGEPGIVYGGSTEVPDQSDLISFQKGTTTNITQNVNIDTGVGNSIQSMQIALVDLHGEATKLITPGEKIDDILGARGTVYFGYEDTNFPDDFITLFKGNIDEVNSMAGIIALNIIHPDNFKRANLFTKAESDTTNALTTSNSPIVEDASSFFTPVLGPNGTIDTTIRYYGVIDGSEVFHYTGISGNTFSGVTRGVLGTIASTHNSGVSVESLVRINGNAIKDIALKLMMSGWDGPFIENIPIISFVQKDLHNIPNAIYFDAVSIKDTVNIIVGDYITITGAAVGGNNIIGAVVTEIVDLDDGSGSYITTDQAVALETLSSAVMSVRSQYDTWGVGRGMQMRSDDIDIDEHLAVFNSFLSSFAYDFYIKDGIDDSKEFLDKQVYNPAGAFSLVRQARASVGAQAPPLPTDIIKILNDSNIKSAERISLKRSSSRNFYNGIVYKFEDQITEDKLLRIEAVLSGDSKSRFGQNIPDKFLVIESKGMRENLSARLLANNVGTRRLQSYQFGAEYINGLNLNLEAGLTVEAGDVVLLDMSQLQVSDIQTGSRSGDPRLWRINKKSFNVKTGAVSIDVVDTNFDKSVRYGLISPSSNLKSINSQTEFVIEPSFGASLFGINEFKKWQDYIGINVVIRNSDFTLVGAPVAIDSISGNTITISSDPGITLAAGMVMTFAPYDQLGVSPVVATAKLIYASISDDENDFADGGVVYRII